MIRTLIIMRHPLPDGKILEERAGRSVRVTHHGFRKRSFVSPSYIRHAGRRYLTRMISDRSSERFRRTFEPLVNRTPFDGECRIDPLESNKTMHPTRYRSL
ncbi:hypothetical protein [Oceaniferula spumae]|uniref:hypothetical protein n=1 Tax=Oceaniferula spumae TaxID=2979115 RepID=UPI003F4EE89D